MKISTLLTLACASLTTAHALDLTPVKSFRVLERVKIPVVSFDDGKRKVNWQPPRDWQLSGGDSQLSLYPPNAQLAQMQLRIISSEAALVPDPASAQDDFLKWAMAFLPGDASNVLLDHEAASPFILDGLHSREFTLNYVSSARKCTTSVALVNLNDTQSLAVVISSRAEDFPEIHAAGTKSMFRWNWVEKLLPSESVTAEATAPEAPRISANKPASAR